VEATTPSPPGVPHRPVPPTSAEAPDLGPGRPDTIRSFAFFPYRGDERLTGPEAGIRAWADVLSALASLAEPEEWTGTELARTVLPILNSYVRYTYQRLVIEDKIAVTDDGEYAAFNTGLLTQYAEDIFGLFQKNRSENPNAQPWFFLRWATESDRDIMKCFPESPQMAEYVTTAADLVYDWRRELKLNYEHIIGDNVERFPPELAGSPARARSALAYAVELTLKRVRRNYKLVVPEWYPRLREAGFLMPLDLTGSGNADLALVVSAVGDNSYRGHTVLTLEMAYTHARLVARPDSEWLKPQAPEAAVLEDAPGDE